MIPLGVHEWERRAWERGEEDKSIPQSWTIGKTNETTILSKMRLLRM